MSYYSNANNTWKILKPKLNIARWRHSACTLEKTVYVFCGRNKYYDLNSIEMISESKLMSNATILWQLINVAEHILAQVTLPAVAPINDTEIAILGGFKEGFSGKVVVFNTTTK